MAQHVLLGELAPLAIVAGLTGPLLRPLLAYRWIHRLRVLAHPLIAWPLWAVNLYLWHLPFFYEAALGNDVVHALEHVMFFTAGALFWAPVLEPLPAPRWFGTGASCSTSSPRASRAWCSRTCSRGPTSRSTSDYVHPVALLASPPAPTRASPAP